MMVNKVQTDRQPLAAYLRLLVFALIGRLKTLHRHTLIGRLKAPEPMVGLHVALTLVFTGTSGQNK